MPFSNELKFLVDEAYHGKRFGDLASAPVGAMGGLTHEQGRQIMAALDVKTIAEFAKCKYVLWAQAITNLAKAERVDAFNPSLQTILDAKWEKKGLRAISQASPAVLAGLSENDARILSETMQVRSVEDLATNRFVLIAQVIAHLARYETDASLRQAA